MERTSDASDSRPVVSLCDVRRARQHARTAEHQAPHTSGRDTDPQTAEHRAEQTGGPAAGFPDLALIAREPSYALRRRTLADAIKLVSGSEPDARILDHQMILLGLVFHHAQHGARRLAIPKSLLSALDDHVAAGSVAARLVRDWLEARSVPCGKRRLWVHEGGKP